LVLSGLAAAVYRNGAVGKYHIIKCFCIRV
jgi:hypothetical protein